MSNNTKFYIDGAWVEPAVPNLFDVINPATEEVAGQISLGSSADVDRAVAAARRAFPAFSQTSREERIALLQKDHRRLRGAQRRACARDDGGDGLAHHVLQRGADRQRAHPLQGDDHGPAVLRVRALHGRHADPARADRRVRPDHAVELAAQPDHVEARARDRGRLHGGAQAERDCAAERDPVCRDPARCRRAQGRVQSRQRRWPDGRRGDLARIPISTWCRSPARPAPAMLVAKAAADTVKRVVQELGGKSANILLPDADLDKAVPAGVLRCFTNTGQSCQAPTRMLVHRSQRDAAVALAKTRGRSGARRRSARSRRPRWDRWSARRSSTRCRG